MSLIRNPVRVAVVSLFAGLTLFQISSAMAQWNPIPNAGLLRMRESRGNKAEIYLHQVIAGGKIAQVRVQVPEGLRAEFESLARNSSLVRFRNGQFVRTADGYVALGAPTQISGWDEIRGVLERKSDGTYEVDGDRVVFAARNASNGYEFDQQSIDFYVGKRISGIGSRLQDAFEIRSLVPQGLYGISDAYPIAKEELRALWAQNPEKTLIQELAKNKWSRDPGFFQTKVFDGSIQPRAGDSVLIITLSGRQGDAHQSSNGHFAVGVGEVLPDGELEGEIFNIYAANNKGVTPGNTDLRDYFGHLNSGQVNYRPTYTLLLSGVNPSRIQGVRNLLEKYYPLLRKMDSRLPVSYNCTTISIQGLARYGIYGQQRNSEPESFRILPETPYKPGTVEKLGPTQLEFLLTHDVREFLPRAAFYSLLSNIPYLNEHERLGAGWVHFVFEGQVPSGRPRGGINVGEKPDFLSVFFRGVFSSEQAREYLETIE